MKKAIFGAWTDNEDSSSSSDEEEPTNTSNLCLMALENEEVQSPDSQYEFIFDELIFAFYDLMSEFKKAESRISTLKNINENLEKERNKFLDKNDALKQEINSLSKKYIISEKEKEVYINENKK